MSGFEKNKSLIRQNEIYDFQKAKNDFFHRKSPPGRRLLQVIRPGGQSHYKSLAISSKLRAMRCNLA